MDRLEEAVARFRQGDSAAFQEIVEGTSDLLVRLCARILGNAEDAEDAVQDAYLKAYRALLQGQFDQRSTLKTWLYRIATNAALDLLRSRKAPPPAESVLPAVSHEQAEQRLALSELAGWLGGLPEEQRLALLLSAVEGLPSAEIGEILGCSEGAVEQRLVRARTMLRKKRGDGLMEAEETTEQRLERLRRATHTVRARGGFSGRVTARIEAEMSWQDALLAPAWRLLPIAFVAAAMACMLAYRSHIDASAALVWSEEPVGVVWE